MSARTTFLSGGRARLESTADVGGRIAFTVSAKRKDFLIDSGAAPTHPASARTASGAMGRAMGGSLIVAVVSASATASDLFWRTSPELVPWPPG
ncbi:hypothetical protein N7925_00265 [Streptomyces sp. CA-278952]|uniref:hypothetical protein n=1 Tax=Streptomyces sp. CA-278952 TaxID=2980556 RepID=UPI00236763DF|nr:hypothetical protein [Streptomyces sp. CA-278952]WDG26872.1 hypothetical protein N7925_00265 [Streptomyces sp. CA-278952]